MQPVRDVAVENSSVSKTTAETIEELAELVMKLGHSVSDFKLPAATRQDD